MKDLSKIKEKMELMKAQAEGLAMAGREDRILKMKKEWDKLKKLLKEENDKRKI
jgi:hypothetical protein